MDIETALAYRIMCQTGRMAQTDPPLTALSSDGLVLYPQRDHVSQGAQYLLHVEAMTREDLHSKSRIAGELAARDIEIDRMRAENAKLCRLLARYRDETPLGN